MAVKNTDMAGLNRAEIPDRLSLNTDVLSELIDERFEGEIAVFSVLFIYFFTERRGNEMIR